MIQEYELVSLTADVVEAGLAAGDIGTVLMIYQNGEAYEVEFLTEDGDTIAVLTLLAAQVRQASPKEMTQA